VNLDHPPGILGALFDEYSRAARELQALINHLSGETYESVFDPTTKDPDCRSIRTILSHVVRSGFGYANYIHKYFGSHQISPEITIIEKGDAHTALDQMIDYTKASIQEHWALHDTAISASKIVSKHGPTYTLEQLLEHAIVHILRHRRQIENSLKSRPIPGNQ
jgi:uncharacterized damage-inducible protein DinB